MFKPFALLVWILPFPAASVFGAGLAELPSNQWKLLDDEDNAGGKTFSRAIYAEDVGRLYLWGTGGRKPARNVYERYELESFDSANPAWLPAFSKAAQSKWSANDFPPFRIYCQSGPDGLRWDEGPRLQVVGGYHSVNRVRWWNFDGILRPSPIHTFNDVVLRLGDKLHVLDCATQQMAESDVELRAGHYGHECAMVYDPEHDVCVALIPSSFSGPIQTFLFRYDSGTAKRR